MEEIRAEARKKAIETDEQEKQQLQDGKENNAPPEDRE